MLNVTTLLSMHHMSQDLYNNNNKFGLMNEVQDLLCKKKITIYL